MKRAMLLIGLLVAGSTAGCAGQSGDSAAPQTADACSLAALQPGDIASVQPLWVPNKIVKSPAYTLGGVIVELRAADADTQARARQQAAQCASACAAASEVRASVGASDGKLEVVLRSDDPGTARLMMARAEQRMHGR